MSKGNIIGKTALITGAAKRIGRAISLALADEGANIIVHYNTSRSDADNLALELSGHGVSAWTLQADFANPEEYKSVIRNAIDLAGTLDILVNNASIFPREDMSNVSFESFQNNMQVNAWAPFVLARSFADEMKRGKIINMVDSRVTSTDWTHVGYIWSKHVLHAMTEMMALAYAPNITVNAIGPGLILPPPGYDQSYIDALSGTVPLKRHGDPDDIAEAVVFLLRSDYITGHMIFVDGGRHLKEYDGGSNPH
ncbi:MAG: SDR family oxidoreductase [Armatimonadota bacterium]